MLFQKRREAGWDANNLLPNSSPLATLDCDSCCALRKETQCRHAQRLPSAPGEQRLLTALLILRGSLPFLLLARPVLSSTYRHACRSSFPSLHLFVNPCTKSSWTLGDWFVTCGWVPATLCAMDLPWHVLHAEGRATRLLQHWGHRPCVVSISSHKTVFLQNQKDPHKLSEQQEALCDGQNPLPIYVSVSVRDSYSTNDFKGKDDVSDPAGLKLAAEFLWFTLLCWAALGENSPCVLLAFWRNNLYLHALQF